MWRELLTAGLLFGLGQAQLSAKCSKTLSAKYPLPTTEDGYVIRLVANGLTLPRSIKFDNKGHLLVVESGVGVSALTLKDSGGGCIQATSKKTVVSKTSLDHGLELSPDNTMLFASDPDKLYRYGYSSSTQSVNPISKVLVDGMGGEAHVTRTLYLSKFSPGMMLINHGSFDDVDYSADDVSTGSSQIRAFDINNAANLPYDFSTSGTIMGHGLRNDVGIDEEPTKGGVYSVENGLNTAVRDGKDIHVGNPGEEMNFLGYVDGTPRTPNRGANFGYPACISVYDADIPGFNGRVGDVIGMSSKNDSLCANQRQAPSLVFEAHSAPIDVLFNDAGTKAWITFRGSDLITPARGFGVGTVDFSNGKPVASVHNANALTYIAQSRNVARCSKMNCWAPVSLAWDSKGRLFVSADYTGEIYVILRSDGTGPNS